MRTRRENVADSAIDQELTQHIELEASELVSCGVPPEEALRQARLLFGNRSVSKEAVRSVWHSVSWEQLLMDLRLAARRLLRNPGASTASIICLALGIGMSLSALRLLDAVRLKILPVGPVHEISYVRVNTQQPLLSMSSVLQGMDGYCAPDVDGNCGRTSISYAALQYLRQHAKLSEVFAFAPCGLTAGNLSVKNEGRFDHANGELVTGNYFSGLRIVPVLGRTITEADSEPGAPRVAVISYRYWVSAFSRDPDVLSRSIVVDNARFQIVGVAQRDFAGIDPHLAADVWVPLRNDAMVFAWGRSVDAGRFENRRLWWLVPIVVRHSGVDNRQAELEIQGLLGTYFAAQDPDHSVQKSMSVALASAERGLDFLMEDHRRTATQLIQIAIVFLIISNANVIMLQLSRSSARQHELAVRIALGSTRTRVMQQLVSESAIIGAFAGALGVLMSVPGTSWLLTHMQSASEALGANTRFDLVAFIAVATLCLGSALVIGLALTAGSTRVDVCAVLQHNHHRGTARRRKGQAALVVLQVALSLLLSTGAVLLIRSRHNLEVQNLGFDRHHLLTLRLDASRSPKSRERPAQTYREILKRVEALPGVQAVSTSLYAQMRQLVGYTALNLAPRRQEQPQHVLSNSVTGAFFRTLAIPIVRGRDFEGDREADAALINQEAARRMFGETDPIGKTFRIDRGFGEKEYKEYSVIGVVGDAKYGRLRADIRPTIFMSVPLSTNRLYLHVRTYGDPAAALPVVRRAIAEIDPDLPIMEEQSATKDIDDQLVRERLLGSLYGFFGVAALAFAALALYSTMSSAIHLRTSELGLRLAIGASPASIAALVTREALKILALGMVLGLPLTWAAANWIAGELYGVSPHDLPAFAISSGIVTVVATLAVVGPALWAVRVEPMTALRHQ